MCACEQTRVRTFNYKLACPPIDGKQMVCGGFEQLLDV
jgi:uncharacterized protein YbaA (DUF1428 family)